MGAETSIIDQSAGIYALLEQDQIWFDIRSQRHEIAEMSVRYKANVIGWLERRAHGFAVMYGIGKEARIWGASAPVVIGVDDNGDPIESRKSYSMAPTPGSMAADMLEAELDAETTKQLADPVAWIRTTPLVRRLLDDIANGRGGTDGDAPARATGRPHMSECPTLADSREQCTCDDDSPEWTI